MALIISLVIFKFLTKRKKENTHESFNYEPSGIVLLVQKNPICFCFYFKKEEKKISWKINMKCAIQTAGKKIPKKSYVLCVNVINNTLIMIKKIDVRYGNRFKNASSNI